VLFSRTCELDRSRDPPDSGEAATFSLILGILRDPDRRDSCRCGDLDDVRTSLVKRPLHLGQLDLRRVSLLAETVDLLVSRRSMLVMISVVIVWNRGAS